MKARKWPERRVVAARVTGLQWSRADEGAEMSECRTFVRNTSGLQWSRADEGAEIW